jgi:LuxR family maltose regulon positive regulatory protein
MPILTTKLYIPPLLPKAVPRPRLIERLDRGWHRRLTLISAPAGFGKTTLACEWISGGKRPAAWLSLDERDNDTVRFLTYLIAALQTIAENIGEGVLDMLQSPQPPPVESLLTLLINEITAVQESITIILDDYHVIDSEPIDTALTFLLENLPPQVHLVIATREDPRLPLPRLRARGQLNELRAADLRFSESEAADFINQVMGLNLSKDFERAAHLAELACPELDENYQTDILLGWLRRLPEDLLRSRPVLSVEYAWTILDEGDVEKVEPLLQDAERWLNAGKQAFERPDGEAERMVVVDRERFRSLPATIANIRALLALFTDDVPGTLKYAQRALGLIPEQDHFRRGTITGTLGLAYWTIGDLERAYRSFSDCMANLKKAGKIHLAISVTCVLADIRYVQGRLHDALNEYDSSLQLAASSDKPLPLATAELYQGLSVLNREQGHLETATENLLKSKELGEKAALPNWQYRLYLAQARIKETQKDPHGALELLREAEHLNLEPYFPDIRPVAALKTRVRIGQGRLTEALNWVRERNLSVNDELSFMQEFEHITLARIRITEYKVSRSEHSVVEAIALLERLEKAAELGGRMGSLIEILVLQALAYAAQDDIPSALTPLARALALAEPEGYVRIFLDEGLPMAGLLSEAAASGIRPDYVSRLQILYKREEQKSQVSSMPPDPPDQPLIEPLSKRELEVLRLIAQGLSNRAIGERLFVALDTVKGHNRNIYGKLPVRRRTEAVARARELGLL